MCGIAGIVDPSASTPADALTAITTAMADRLAHRGPDDRGDWADPVHGVAFGHRRLSIIDLSPAGHQPMTSRSGRHVLVYNGELYNHRELRAEVAATGVQFRGTSDTEVLVEAIAAWGVAAALDRANGMFAFGVWDRERRTLTLARDRLGEKPLYYGEVGAYFAFASELDAFRGVPKWSPTIDRVAVGLYLEYGFVPHPWSIFEGIRQLPPGSLLEVAASSARERAEPTAYWSLRDVARRGFGRRASTPADNGDLVDELEALLDDAIRRRLVADVPVGAFLSGGIDSTTIAALARGAGDLRTFTVRIPSAGLDESREAALVAAHLGTAHTTVDLSQHDALDAVRRVPIVHDEPFADPSAIPTALLCRAAREHVKVCLSGDGGDEIFGGYNRYVIGRSVWSAGQRTPRAIRRAGARVLSLVPARLADSMARALPTRTRLHDPAAKARKLTALLTTDDAVGWWTALVQLWDGALPLARTVELPTPRSLAGDPPPVAEPVEELLWLDGEVVLPDDMLVKVDRSSMAVSLEVRVPLLDHRLVEFAWRLPVLQKIQDRKGKVILREVLARHVPADLTDRAKVGFDPPLGEWLRGPLRGWADDLLDARRLRDTGLVDPVIVRAAWDDHLARRSDRTYDLWSALSLEAWKEARWPTAS